MTRSPTGIFLGTYAEGGGGLVPVTIDGGLSFGQPFANVRNASFAAVDETRGIVHFVDEQERGLVRSCRLDAGRWHVLAEAETGGAAPCYVALDASCSRLAVANYEGGNLALFALDAHGLPTQPPEVWQSHGSGPVGGRQDSAHLHCVLFDGDLLYAVDLGSDRIVAFDLSEGLSQPSVAFHAPAGSGPRHVVLHPDRPIAYLLSELAATVTVLDRIGSRLVSRTTMKTAPATYAGENLGGHIALGRSGTRLYVTNRGHDSIATFSVAADGSLALLQHVSSEGASPRSVALLEQAGICLVANEEGETLVSLPLGENGMIGQATDVAPAPGAAFAFVMEV